MYFPEVTLLARRRWRGAAKKKEILDSQISWNSATEIVEFSENDFPKAKKIRKNYKRSSNKIRSNSELEKT